MIRAAFAALGRLILFLAGLTFVAALSIFVFGSFVLTWPVLRLSPRDQKLRATVNFASAGMSLFTILGEAKAKQALVEALAMADKEGVHVQDDRPWRKCDLGGKCNAHYCFDDDRCAATEAATEQPWPEEGISATMTAIPPDEPWPDKDDEPLPRTRPYLIDEDPSA